jgi:hypothetical protein
MARRCRASIDVSWSDRLRLAMLGGAPRRVAMLDSSDAQIFPVQEWSYSIA